VNGISTASRGRGGQKGGGLTVFDGDTGRGRKGLLGKRKFVILPFADSSAGEGNNQVEASSKGGFLPNLISLLIRKKLVLQFWLSEDA